MNSYFNIEEAIQATDGYDAYQRIFSIWARDRLRSGDSRRIMPFAEYVSVVHPDVYNRARAYARVMGEL